jgi:putative chitinase
MVPITAAQLLHLAPNARSSYRDAFAAADHVLAPYGINANPRRVAHFMAQVLHETGALTILVENLNYTATRLVQVWPSRFKTVAAATPYAHNPEKLADFVYGGRMGNTQAGDGWRFIGRGLLQITGRESYARYGHALGIDLVGTPDLAFSAASCLQVAAEEWTASGCNALADADNVRKVTRAINGGLVGLASRQDWLAKTKHVWGG